MARQNINPEPATHGEARAKINFNFTEVYTNVSAIEVNIDEIESGISAIEVNIDEIETNVSAIEVNIDDIESSISAIDNTSDLDKPVSTAQGVAISDSVLTDEEIKTAYENNADTNAFTDDDKTALDLKADQIVEIYSTPLNLNLDPNTIFVNTADRSSVTFNQWVLPDPADYEVGTVLTFIDGSKTMDSAHFITVVPRAGHDYWRGGVLTPTNNDDKRWHGEPFSIQVLSDTAWEVVTDNVRIDTLINRDWVEVPFNSISASAPPSTYAVGKEYKMYINTYGGYPNTSGTVTTDARVVPNSVSWMTQEFTATGNGDTYTRTGSQVDDSWSEWRLILRSGANQSDTEFAGKLLASGNDGSDPDEVITYGELADQSISNSLARIGQLYNGWNRFQQETELGGIVDNGLGYMHSATHGNWARQQLITNLTSATNISGGNIACARDISIAGILTPYINPVDNEGVVRFVVGDDGTGVPTVAKIDALTGRGWGFEVYSVAGVRKVKIFTHDGTTYTESAGVDQFSGNEGRPFVLKKIGSNLSLEMGTNRNNLANVEILTLNTAPTTSFTTGRYVSVYSTWDGVTPLTGISFDISRNLLIEVK